MKPLAPRARRRPESTHEYCPCAPAALVVPRSHEITHSYTKMIKIPGVSRRARCVLVVVQAAIVPAQEVYWPWCLSAPALRSRLSGDGNGVWLGAAVPAVAAGVDLAGVPQVPPVE